jgi:hypothetical protein
MSQNIGTKEKHPRRNKKVRSSTYGCLQWHQVHVIMLFVIPVISSGDGKAVVKQGVTRMNPSYCKCRTYIYIYAFFRLLGKVLANGLSPHLDQIVLHTQSAFIKRCMIQDNF